MKTVLSFFAISAIAGAVLGDTVGVCPDGCEFNDIQAAIDAASDGDVIMIGSGTYQPSQPLNTNGKAVTLLGSLDKAGSPTTTIDGQDSIQLLRMTNDEGPGTIVQNIEFIRGSGESGGAIHCTGVNPVIRNCIFDDNFALLAGGGIYCFGSNPFVYFCTFTNNRCSYDGGGSCNLLSSSTFELCVFESNIASGGSGGGMANYSGSDVVLKSCSFLQNSASSLGGGGMYNSTSSPELMNCLFQGNTTNGEGGGMYNYQASPSISNGTFDSNSANTAGGGMGNRDDSSPTFFDTVFTGNTSSQGAGMRNRDSDPTFNGCTFSGNIASGDGGGISNYYSCNLSLTDCLFEMNSSGNVSGGGGAIFTNGLEKRLSHVALYNTVFSGNTAIGRGGAIRNHSQYSSATLENCAFVSNTATFGSGISNLIGSVATISNCEFSECCGVDPITTAIDQGGNNTLYICAGCEGDVNCDGEVGSSDLGRLLSAWGPSIGRYDLNADGMVSGADLGLLFATWGPCR